MKILVIDGMGGGIGRAVIERLSGLNGVNITAVGTNSMATSAMLKAGARIAATGENAVVVNAERADVIIGVVGIIAANAMHGEITPKMAEAVASACAHKILIPIDKCNITVAGTQPAPIQTYINNVLDILKEL